MELGEICALIATWRGWCIHCNKFIWLWNLL